MKICALIVAGGSGRRMGSDKNKVLLDFAGKTVLRRTADTFCECKWIDEIIVVTRLCDRAECIETLDGCGNHIVYADGGDTRQMSVYNGLMACPDADYVLIHDAARALITRDIIQRVTDDCIRFGSAAAGVKCKDTLKSIDSEGFITNTIDREYTYNIQTPQAFKYDLIINAHKKASEEGISVTDDCALAEHYGHKIKLTEGSYENIKLTTPEDMAVGEIILKGRKCV